MKFLTRGRATSNLNTAVRRLKNRTYVLATKYSDRDPHDAWAVGYIYAVRIDGAVQIEDGHGKLLETHGQRWFKYTTEITEQEGLDCLEFISFMKIPDWTES